MIIPERKRDRKRKDELETGMKGVWEEKMHPMSCLAVTFMTPKINSNNHSFITVFF
jgi:hypothetical protein